MFSGSLRRSLVVIGLVCAIVPSVAGAQVMLTGPRPIGFNRPESWAMKYFAAVTTQSSFGAPRALEAGDFEIALEYGQVPSLTEAERRVGFIGTKVDDLNRVPAIFRPVVFFGLGRKLTLSAGFLPPVEESGVEAGILTMGISRPLHVAESWRAGWRVHGQIGTIDGDFTCSRRAVSGGEDRELNPFGCEAVSRDEYDVQGIGLEVSGSLQLGRWEPYAAVSFNHQDLELQIRAEYSRIVDRSLLQTEGSTWSASAGVGYRVSKKWELIGEVFYSPLDVFRPPSTSIQTDELINVRSLLRYRVR